MGEVAVCCSSQLVKLSICPTPTRTRLGEILPVAFFAAKNRVISLFIRIFLTKSCIWNIPWGCCDWGAACFTLNTRLAQLLSLKLYIRARKLTRWWDEMTKMIQSRMFWLLHGFHLSELAIPDLRHSPPRSTASYVLIRRFSFDISVVGAGGGSSIFHF